MFLMRCTSKNDPPFPTQWHNLQWPPHSGNFPKTIAEAQKMIDNWNKCGNQWSYSLAHDGPFQLEFVLGRSLR